MEVAKLWLSQCLGSHKGFYYDSLNEDDDPCAACDGNGPAKDYAAVRLLEISASHVRTVPAAKVKQPYATLSYSWGSGPQWPWGPQRIERVAISAMLDVGLPRSSLPKTISDAVWVAEQLGLDYLWVDVLCIRQDDAEFVRESVKMATIYSEALLCISASSSAGNDAGLFNKRSRSQHKGFAAHIPIERSDGVRPDGLVFYQRRQYLRSSTTFPWSAELEEDVYRQDVEAGRLSERAWGLQERICSPRILHFGTTQMLWQCNRTIWTEDNLGLQTYMDLGRSIRTWKVLFFPIKLEDHVGVNRTLAEEYEALKRTLEDMWSNAIIPDYYSGKLLTHWDDKLMAIAGLAKKIWQQDPSLQYVAGHWREGLPTSLLWYASTPSRRIAPYVAPSWSWASLQGRVQMDEDIVIGDDAVIRCNVIDCWAVTSNGDQFGRVLDAGLEIEATALRGTVAGRKTPNSTSANIYLDGIDGAYTRAELDDDRDDNLRVFALLIKQCFVQHPNPKAPWHWAVLLIVPKDERHERFTRVGFGVVSVPFVIPADDERLLKSRWVLV